MVLGGGRFFMSEVPLHPLGPGRPVVRKAKNPSNEGERGPLQYPTPLQSQRPNSLPWKRRASDNIHRTVSDQSAQFE